MGTPRATAPKRVVRTAPAEPIPPTWEALSAVRWGPGLTDDEPSIDVPRDWRDTVAGWPHGRWSRWRSLSGELLAGQDDEPTAEDIRAADRAAYDLMQAGPAPDVWSMPVPRKRGR